MKRRFLTFMLLAGILLLPGCGTESGRNGEPAVKYTAQYIMLDIDANISYACISDGNVWLTGYRSEGENTSAYLAAADENGKFLGDFSGVFSTEAPEGRTWETSAAEAVFPLPNGGAAVYGLDIYSYEDIDNPLILPDGRQVPTSALESIYFVVSVDSSGEPAGRIELPEELCSNVLSFAADGENYYFMTVDGTITVLRHNGAELCTIQTVAGELAPLDNGRVAHVDTAGNIRPVDADGSRLGDRIGAREDYAPQSGTLFPGGMGWDMLINCGTTLLGCNNNGERSEIVTWLNVDINGRSVMYVGPAENGNGLICVCGDENGNGGKDISIVHITPADGEGSDKAVLRLFCMGLSDDISKQILAFNRTSTDYRIEVRDYTIYSDAAYTRMSADLTTGDMPDIFCTDGLPADTYAASGMLENLWPYIDADSELGGREALVLPLFEAMSKGGSLYEVTDCFAIRTVVGYADYAKSGWSMADFMAAYEKMPAGCDVFGADFTRMDALYMALSLRFEEFVDAESGSCRFDSEDFRDIVRFSELVPENAAGYDDDEFARIATGEQMLLPVWVNDVFGLDKAMCAFGDDGAALGMPGAEGSGSAFEPGSGLAMSASCEHKDGAWTFLRRLLLPRNQSANVSLTGQTRLPSNRSALERLIADAGTPNIKEGTEVPKYVMWSQGRQYAAYALTEEKTAALNELISSTDNVCCWDESLFGVISEELGAYYCGDKTLEQATKNIQSRVELYLQSQK